MNTLLQMAQGIASATTARHRSSPSHVKNTMSVRLLGLMMAVVPAVGMPSDDALQDTLKSALVSILAILSGLAFFWEYRQQPRTVWWHGSMWIPLLLMSYALSSMAWSHPYLAGVEAARWMVITLLMWLGMQARPREFEDCIFWGIHWGVTIASIWIVLQFWCNFDLFPQGPNPGSTFANRNFFAEYAICALPFSGYLLLRSQKLASATGLSANIGFNVVALLMTGTRSAIIALAVLAIVATVFYASGKLQAAHVKWNQSRRLTIAAGFASTILCLGFIPSHNKSLVADFGSLSAISRATMRTKSLADNQEYASGSFSIRLAMWKATSNMIYHHPVAGVGAGAWEMMIPFYEDAEGSSDPDFYAHNEILQLLSEYGLIGWLCLICWLAYMCHTGWKVLTARSDLQRQMALPRAIALCSLLMLYIVSNAGFPLHMASTCALFALNMSLCGACDIQTGLLGRIFSTFYPLGRKTTRLALFLGSLLLATALYITQRAAECEASLVWGIKLALTISHSSQPNDPHWKDAKLEMMESLQHGIALNGHYRKFTSVAADTLELMGDWENALWVLKTVHQSRPYMVHTMVEIANANLELGRLDNAAQFITAAQKVQATAPAIQAIWLKLGNAYAAKPTAINQEKALAAFRSAAAASTTPITAKTLKKIHSEYRNQL